MSSSVCRACLLKLLFPHLGWWRWRGCAAALTLSTGFLMWKLMDYFAYFLLLLAGCRVCCCVLSCRKLDVHSNGGKIYAICFLLFFAAAALSWCLHMLWTHSQGAAKSFKPTRCYLMKIYRAVSLSQVGSERLGEILEQRTCLHGQRKVNHKAKDVLWCWIIIREKLE